jgi:hypothetical protein
MLGDPLDNELLKFNPNAITPQEHAMNYYTLRQYCDIAVIVIQLVLKRKKEGVGYKRNIPRRENIVKNKKKIVRKRNSKK